MEYPTTIILDWIANYFWPFTRISSMLMVMTVTGARFVSPRIRLYLSLAITLALMPAIPAVPEEIQLLSFQGFLTTFEQIVIGVAMGDGDAVYHPDLCPAGSDFGYAIEFGFRIHGGPCQWSEHAVAWSVVYVPVDHVFPRHRWSPENAAIGAV